MFQLSQTHNQAFRSKSEADFVREVMQCLRENHVETIVKLPNGEFKVADLPEATLQKMVEGGITKARSYGMTWRSTLISFVVIMFVSAPNFDENEQIRKILETPVLPMNIRVDLLWDKTKNEDWEQIQEEYDYTYWNL